MSKSDVKPLEEKLVFGRASMKSVQVIETQELEWNISDFKISTVGDHMKSFRFELSNGTNPVVTIQLTSNCIKLSWKFGKEAPSDVKFTFFYHKIPTQNPGGLGTGSIRPPNVETSLNVSMSTWTDTCFKIKGDFVFTYNMDALGYRYDKKLKAMTAFTKDYVSKMPTLEEHCDVDVICQKKVFPCHKFVLATRSKVLADMMRTKTKEERHEVHIKDFNPQIVEKMIQFMYRDELSDVEPSDTEELLKIADKFEFLALKEVCEVNMMKTLNVDNALNLLHFGRKYSADRMTKKASEIVQQNIASLIGTKAFGVLVADFPYIFQK